MVDPSMEDEIALRLLSRNGGMCLYVLQLCDHVIFSQREKKFRLLVLESKDRQTHRRREI